MSRTDTIGWNGELLVKAIFERNEVLHIVHNSMPDADDPTVGISLHGKEVRIPMPDFLAVKPGNLCLKRTRGEPRVTALVEG